MGRLMEMNESFTSWSWLFFFSWLNKRHAGERKSLIKISCIYETLAKSILSRPRHFIFYQIWSMTAHWEEEDMKGFMNNLNEYLRIQETITILLQLLNLNETTNTSVFEFNSQFLKSLLYLAGSMFLLNS